MIIERFLQSKADTLESVQEGMEYIPEYMHDGLSEYILRGQRPGGFMCAVLANSFVDACLHADTENSLALAGWAKLLVNITPLQFINPSSSEMVTVQPSGNEDRVERWIQVGGLQGIEEKIREKVESGRGIPVANS